jgi:hypothetical protein
MGDCDEAVVLYSRVTNTAAEHHEVVDDAALLGAAMAHEIAHLILGSVDHSTGVMRAQWGKQELLLIGHGCLRFPPRDVARMHRALKAREGRVVREVLLGMSGAGARL